MTMTATRRWRIGRPRRARTWAALIVFAGVLGIAMAGLGHTYWSLEMIGGYHVTVRPYLAAVMVDWRLVSAIPMTGIALSGSVTVALWPQVWSNSAGGGFGLPLWIMLVGAGGWLVASSSGDERMRQRYECGSCGYDLRGTPAGQACPECGLVQRQAHVGRLEPTSASSRDGREASALDAAPAAGAARLRKTGV